MQGEEEEYYIAFGIFKILMNFAKSFHVLVQIIFRQPKVHNIENSSSTMMGYFD
jgi:hypothetical protein